MRKIETIEEFINMVDSLMRCWDHTDRTGDPIIKDGECTLIYDRGLHPTTIKVIWDNINNETHIIVKDCRKSFIHAYTSCLEFPSSISLKCLVYETL